MRPVPPSFPSIRMRARFALVPGLSLRTRRGFPSRGGSASSRRPSFGVVIGGRAIAQAARPVTVAWMWRPAVWRFHGKPGGKARAGRRAGADRTLPGRGFPGVRARSRAPASPAAAATAAKAGQAASSTTIRAPARSAASAAPGASAQSSAATLPPAARPRRGTTAPPRSRPRRAPRATAPARGPAAAAAARACARPCTVTAGGKFMRAPSPFDPEAPLCHGFFIPCGAPRGKACVASGGR